jgi:predicted transcriptional regulator
MTERWTDERLDRLALAVESNTEGITELRQGFIELQRSMRGMTQAMAALARTQIEVLQRVDESQAEVKGLQTEMRHIWGHLFGE